MSFPHTVGTVLASINGHSQIEAIKYAKRLFSSHIYDVIAEAEIETILIGGPHPLIPAEDMPAIQAYLRKKIEKAVRERGSTQLLVADYCSRGDNPTDVARRGALLRAAQRELLGWESLKGLDIQVVLLDPSGSPIGIAR